MAFIEKAVQATVERQKLAKLDTAAPPPATEIAPARRPAAHEPLSREPINFSSLTSVGYLANPAEDPEIVTDMRRLKRSVLQSAFSPLADHPASIVMITSPGPGVGKSYLSANLAQGLAMERDRTVVLIDCDNHRPTLTTALGLQGQPGFFDVLHDPLLSLEDCIRQTEFPGLAFLPAGRHHADGLELLNSDRARTILNSLSRGSPGRLVVLDTPPLLAVPDTPIIGSLAGQVLVAVEAGVTTESSVMESLELLNRDKPIGLVLNKVPRSSLFMIGSSYGDYYGYGYGYGTAGKTDRDAPR